MAPQLPQATRSTWSDRNVVNQQDCREVVGIELPELLNLSPLGQRCDFVCRAKGECLNRFRGLIASACDEA
jgi:hypothetical protein